MLDHSEIRATGQAQSCCSSEEQSAVLHGESKLERNVLEDHSDVGQMQRGLQDYSEQGNGTSSGYGLFRLSG